MFSFSFDDLYPNSRVSLVGYDTPSPTIGGFDTSTLPDFGSVTSFSNTFQDITSAQMPSFTFAFDSNYMQMPQFEVIRNLVPNMLLQQDQIKAVNNDLINKIPALQQQFDGYKAAYSDYETKLNNYNNFEAYANSLGAQKSNPMGVKYYPNSVNGPVIVGPQVKNRGSYYPAWEIYKSGTTNTQGRWVATNYADIVRASTDNLKNYKNAYDSSYTAYQTEAQRLKDSVDQYNNSVRDYEAKTKAVAEETRRQIEAEKERKELERKQEEDRLAAETRAEQERIAEQQRLEKIALEQKQQEEARLAEIKRQQDEAEQARLKAEEEARNKAEDDARLKQIADELEKKRTIDTKPTLVASTGNASVTLVSDKDGNVSSTVTTPSDEPKLPAPTGPEPPDIDPTEPDPTAPITDPGPIIVSPIVDPTRPTGPTGPVVTKPTTDPTKPTTPPVTDPTAPVLPPVTPPITDPTVDPITVNPPPDDEVPVDEVPIDEVPVDEVPVDDKEKPPTKTIKNEPSVNLTILDIPNRRNLPTKTNRALASSLNLNTNVGTVLGTGLATRPDISSTSEPYLLESDNKKRRDVWNTESLRGALGI
jgi:hypothetical protein